MKGIIITILLALSTLSGYSQTTDTLTMTLEECLNYAFEHNQNVIISELETDIAKAKVGEVTSQGLPQVSGNVAFNKNLIIRKMILPASTFDPSAPEGELVELQFGTPYDGDVGLNASQMIFDGSYFVGLQASKTYQELSQKEHIKTKIDVAEAVTKAYYTVLVNKISLETAKVNFQRLDSLLRETRLMNENGFVERIDLKRTQVRHTNAKTLLTSNERSLEISKELLKFQMGMPMEENIEIAESLEDLEFNMEEDLNISTDFKRRIEYSQLETNQRLAELDLKNNRVQYLPNIDLVFNWGINSGVTEAGDLFKFGNRQLWPESQVIGLTMHVPIFDGFYKAKKIQQNKIKLKQLMHQREMLENSIRVDVEQTRKDLITNSELLDIQAENVKIAEEVYNDARIKYQEGVGSSLEVIEADSDFKDAQSNYFNALYTALISSVNYQRALGILYTE